MRRREFLGVAAAAGVSSLVNMSGADSQLHDAIELFSLNAAFTNPSSGTLAWPRVALLDQIKFMESYALVGMTLSTVVWFEEVANSAIIGGVIVVLNQITPEIVVSANLPSAGAQIFQSAPDGSESEVVAINFDPHAFFIPSGSTISLYGVVASTGETAKATSNANLFLVPAQL